MLKLTVEQYDEAIGIMAHELADCERVMVNTYLSKALHMLEALGEHYDVTPKANVNRPLANDDTDAILAGYWEDKDAETAFSNALARWSQGLTP